MTESFTLAGGGSGQCQKCAQLFKDGATRNHQTATYVLARGMERWHLCLQHAAAASHNLGIRHHVFNPTGVIATTEKKAP